MFQTDTIQIKKPFGYTFLDQQDFLEAQIAAQKEVERYIEYKTFGDKANILRRKTGLKTEKDLERFLSE